MAGDRPAELFQLDRSTCLALLGTQHVGRLVIGGDDPCVWPVNYAVVAGLIVFRTAPEGRAAAATGERVLFEVDMFDDRTRSGWSVIVHGRLGLTPTDEDRAAVVPWAPGARTAGRAVSIDTVTGRLLRGGIEDGDRRDGYL